MASGKTTFGRALARRIGYEFIDLDFYIEQRFRMPVRRIFAEKGEAGFRAMESRMLREAGEFENVVIACGGGTPCIPGNMDYMKSRGPVVCLLASQSRIVERLLLAPGKRPVVAGMTAEELPAFVGRHLAEREPWYSQASIRFASDNLESSRQIGETIDKFMLLPEIQEIIFPGTRR